MRLMKISISLDDKEFFSFDFLVIFLMSIVYLFYLIINFLNLIHLKCEKKLLLNQFEKEDENDSDEEKIINEKEKNQSELENEKNFFENNQKSIITEDLMQVKEKIENSQEKVKVKTESEWMVIRKGKKEKKKI